MSNIAEISEKINSDPLAKIIQSITQAMKADFGQQYAKQFKTDDDMRMYKRRLYTKLKGHEIGDIADGYEMYVDGVNKFTPTIPDLIAIVEQARKNRLHAEANKAEVARISALPAPTITCDPMALLAEAKKAPTGNMAEKMAAHKALLTMHSKHIRNPVFHGHGCAVSHCRNLGSMTTSTKGGETWYCRDHYRNAG